MLERVFASKFLFNVDCSDVIEVILLVVVCLKFSWNLPQCYEPTKEYRQGIGVL